MAALAIATQISVDELTHPAFAALRYQPATGLVDLNTASPVLLRLLLEGYGLPDNAVSESLENYRSWRRQGRKLLRVSDFRRITGLTTDQLPKIEQFATVYSGRTGIDGAQAPDALIRHLLGAEASRDVLIERADPAIFSTGSSVNQHAIGENGLNAIVHLGGGAVASRVLDVK